jgi:hypothetical protein
MYTPSLRLVYREKTRKVLKSQSADKNSIQSHKPGLVMCQLRFIFKCFFILVLAALFLAACAKTYDNSFNTLKLSIDSIVPSSGAAGTPVRIYGKGFAQLPAENHVYFNGSPALLDSNIGIGVLLAFAPANGTTGNLNVANQQDSVEGPVFTYGLVPTILNIEIANSINLASFGYSLFVINGNYFDSLHSVVTIDGQVVNGFVYASRTPYVGQSLSLSEANLPTNLGNPVQVTVSVNNLVSNPYLYFFMPDLVQASPDTVQKSQTQTLQGFFFGNQTVQSTVKAYYIQGGQPLSMSPDPTIVSWNTNSIVISIPNYNSYGSNRYVDCAFQVTVDSLGSKGLDFTYDSQR